MNIGCIGLGLMGAPCAGHLLKAGHNLHIWARNPQKVQPLLEQGAKWSNSPAELAAQVDILITNLTGTADVQSMLLGENGVIHGGNPGLIIIDMSTISATASRNIASELKKKGIDFADAPVSGGTAGAANATLTIMVGADENIFDKIRPVLALLGSKVTRIGDIGAGQVAKSCNQIIVTGTVMAVSEAFKLAKRLDVDLVKIREALSGGFAGSKILEMHGKRILDNDFAPGFKTSLHVKDMHIVDAIAKELTISLPVSEVGLSILEAAIKAGYAEQDSSAMFKVIDANNQE